ncbi:MAG: hypothetical protein EA382_04895 [Spirochaetaceae bacterium]|nr:MAG: hypothetical protein EA382_04895 [Spirochaetaceae bacterium]
MHAGLYGQTVAVVSRDLTDEPQPTVSALLVRRLTAELVARGYQLVDLGPAAHDRGDASEPRVSSVAVGEIPDGLDVIVAAFYRLDGDAVVVQFVLTDPVAGIVVGGVLSRQRAGLTISTSVDAAIDDLRPSLDRWERDRETLRRGMPADRVERIFVYGPQDGVRVRFAALEIGTVRAGRIFVPYSPFPVGSTVPITLSKHGYHERTVDVVLDGRRIETTLPSLTPAGTVGLSLFVTSSFLPGAGVGLRLYPAPDRFYVGFEHYRSIQPQPDVRAVRFYRSRLTLGLSPLSPDLRIRPFAEAGGGVIVTDLAPIDRRLTDDELYSDVYVGVSVGVEAGFGRWKPFVRADVDYSLGFTRSNLLGRRWISPPVTSLPVPVPLATLGVVRTW